MTFKTIADVRAANKAKEYHWFSRDTMKFWKTRIESTLLRGRYFITSEDEWVIDGREPKRKFAVREVTPDASIKTLASYLRSKEDAREFIRRLA